jgi:hypothetical protein
MKEPFPAKVHLRLLRAAHLPDAAPEWENLFSNHAHKYLVNAVRELIDRSLITEELRPTVEGERAWVQWKDRLVPLASAGHTAVSP